VEVDEIKCRGSNISGDTQEILTKLIGTVLEKHNLKILTLVKLNQFNKF